MKQTRTSLMIVLACVAPLMAGETVSYEDLAARVTNLEWLARLPAPGEKCAQWSSYDRKSRYDESTGAYLDWSANGDGGGYIRQENGKLVLGEMKGPGVIWRIWSALPQKGRVAIYLDGQETPAVDLPFSGYFDHKNAPFNRPGLVHASAGGHNCYVPIPYQKSCRILAEPGWGSYYQFTYATYPEGTRLPTFSRDLTAGASRALDKADATVRSCGADPAGHRPGETIQKGELRLAPGETNTMVELDGPGAITGLKVSVELPEPPDDALALRELVIRMYWDGQTEACVCSPLGDFFGSAPGAVEYKSLPLGMTKDGFYSFWYMPFAHGAVIRLSNDGKTERHIRYEITQAPLSRPVDQLARFHARWHQDVDLDPARAIDWTILKTRGQGRFCGVALYVWNPRGGWWGEGDEKFFVDGEKLPSTFGTGSEDYFGYAWCSEQLFQHAFHNQTVSVPRNGCANRAAEDSGGHISNNRWQIADNVPFHTSFEGAIEKYFPNSDLTRYACVAYWYQAEPHGVWEPLPAVQDRLHGIKDQESRMLWFLREGKQYAAGQPIEPLREAYKGLIAGAGLAEYRVRLTLRMARVEKVAGNEREAQSLLAPFMQTLAVPFASRDYADDVVEAMGGPPSPPSQVRPLLVENDDGSVKREMRGGRWCVLTQRDQGRPYIYFALPDRSGLRKKEQPVVLRVTCYSSGRPGCSFVVQYDSAYSNDLADRYRESARVDLPTSAGWHTTTVKCPRARFAGRQNSHADFRIAAAGGDLAIADIQLEPGQ
jgi:hypothetical protein